MKMYHTIVKSSLLCLLLGAAQQLGAQNPGGVSGSRIWLKANSGTSTTTDGVGVSSWNDQSGNANDVSQATTGNRPLYRNNTSDNINFNPVLDFDGVNDNLVDASGVLGTGTYTNASGFAVSVSNSTSQNNTLFAERLSSGILFLLVPASGGDAFWAAPDATNTLNPSWGGSIGTPYMWTGWNNNSLNPRSTIRRNALTLDSASTAISYTGNNQPFNVGKGTTAVNYLNGRMGEIIFFRTAITAAERQRVESYLAIKYGLTLDQTSPQNYLASDGTTIWDGSANSAYQFNIAGIGRDDNSALAQKQSQSVNTGSQVVMALGTVVASNQANANTIPTDRQFFVWGDDNGSLTTQVATGNNTYTYRFSRIWKTQNTGSFAQNSTVYYPVSAFGNAQASTVALLYGSSAASLSNGTATAIAQSGTTTINGASYYAFTVPAAQIANLQFFSFTGTISSPGGVTGEVLWLKADKDLTPSSGTGTITAWLDQSGLGNDIGTIAGTPSRSSTLLNFNPSIDFNADNEGLAATDVIAGADNTWGMFNVFAPTELVDGGDVLAVADLTVATDKVEYTTTGNVYRFSGVTSYNTPSGLVSLGKPNVLSTVSTSAGTTQQFLNGIAGSSAAHSVFSSPNNFVIGDETIGGVNDGLSMNFGESIVYDKLLTATERSQIQSYLALKYAVTLGNSSNLVSYLAPDGTTATWTGSATYQNNIAGIGRDDLTALYQKQSQSVNTGSQVVMALGMIAASNAANANTFSVDKQYFIWGDDNGSLTTLASTGNSTYPYRFTRIWKTQNTGSFAQNITVYFPISAFGNALASTVSLIYGSSAAALSSGSASTIAQSGTTTISGESYYIFSVPAAQVANLQFLSFTATTTSPGGVSSNLQLWLRADAGVTTVGSNVDTWTDQVGNPAITTQATIGTPTSAIRRASNTFNFNPSIAFSGTSGQRLVGNTTGAANFNGSLTIYSTSWLQGTLTDLAGLFSTDTKGLVSTNSLYFADGPGASASTTSNTPAGSSGTPAIASVQFTANSTSGSSAYYNGEFSELFTGTGFASTPASDFEIGGRTFASLNYRIFNGLLPEIINYKTSSQTTLERQRINSYLGIKYGITLGLDNDGDGTDNEIVSGSIREGDYVASDGSTITWPGSSIYRNNVFGIGRDERTALNQQISRSSSAGDSLIFSTDANFSNANGSHTAISGDLKFLIVGHDGASVSTLTALTTGSCPVDGLSRIAREWKVYGTNTMDITHVQINLSAAGFGSDVVMLVCADSSFNTYTIVPGTFTKSSGIFRTKYTFANGRQFITFAGVPSTCTPCETGQLVLKNAATWQAGGTPARTTNVITSVALGTVGSGAMTANLRVLDPSSVEYRPTRYPRTFKGSWLRVGRYENSTTAALTYSIKLSQAAKADFEVGHIVKANGQATRVTFVGYCNGVAVTNPTLSRVRNIASRNTYTISGNVATGIRSVKRLNAVGRVKVNYKQPVDSIAIIFTLLRSPVRKVVRSIFISNINLTCSSPVEPTPDNVYMYQTFNTDTAYTCDTVTMQVKINNMNCTDKILNINNTLPSGLSYNPDSYLGDDVDPSANPVYSGTNFSMTGIVVPPGEHSYYVDVYHSGTIGTATQYKNQTAFTVQGGTGTTLYSDGNIATTNLDSTRIVFKPAVPKVMPDSFVKSCDLSKYSTGGVLTYSFRFVNNSGSPITGLSFEDILDDQLTFQSATLSSSFGGTVLYTDDSASLTIDNMTIPTGTTIMSVKVKVNSSTADMIYNYASLEETVESNCSGSTSRESNEVPTPRQLIDCIMVNPRVSQKLKVP